MSLSTNEKNRKRDWIFEYLEKYVNFIDMVAKTLFVRYIYKKKRFM